MANERLSNAQILIGFGQIAIGVFLACLHHVRRTKQHKALNVAEGSDSSITHGYSLGLFWMIATALVGKIPVLPILTSFLWFSYSLKAGRKLIRGSKLGK